jgi:DHA2 family multidrug resistance protein
MASSAAIRPTPIQIVRGFASAVPSEVSTRPVLGILGVVMGAAIVTLAGRMLTLGLADLKGAVGISYDDGAWISTAFNTALVFIGPFTVYIGGLLGTRRVLLGAAGTFALINIFLPLIHSYSLLIAALTLAGLASGTFYPLTLTFALRSIPPRALPFTVAIYASCVDFSVNIAPSLYGWYRDHLSWHWMFWNSVPITIVMMVLIYYGIPPSPKPKKGAAPSFEAFFYGSAGFAALFAAFDQGERLDWWRSGVFTALFVAGSFFLIYAFVRRARGPNPMVDLPFVGKSDTILLGSLLFLFRFTLLATIVLIPQSLSVHGFEASQIGPALVWTAAAQILIAFVAALMLLRDFDSRLLMAIGFTCVAIACCLNANLTSAWSAANYYRTELLVGVGQSFAFIGLVSTILLHGLFFGALATPQRTLTFSAYFHLVRLFGGNLGGIFMGHFIAHREKLHSYLLGLHVQQGNWITEANVRGLTAGLFAQSTGVAAATGRAVGLTSGRIRLQAYILTFNDGFHLVAWACVGVMLLIALMRRSPLSYGYFAQLKPSAAPSQERKS